MKRIGYLYEKICDIENIKKAIRQSSLGKRNKHFVANILANEDYYATKIQELLINKTFVPSPYSEKVIFDGSNKKERTICKPKYFPDQIVHWALMLQIQPIIERGMYTYNCGSVPKRGTGLGSKMMRQWIKSDYKGTKYCLKMDISKFYPSVDSDLLKGKFRKIIKDNDCLSLIDKIIDSHVGLPIGNFTSQWFANFFLQDLDHYIKEKLGAKYYIRYVDDLVIMGSNKRKLHKIREQISEFLKSEKLAMKNNYQVFRVSERGVDFLGFRFFRNKTILRKRIALRIRRRIRKIFKKRWLNRKDACSIISYWGWIKRSDSYNFYSKYVKPYTKISTARKAVSYYGRQANCLC